MKKILLVAAMVMTLASAWAIPAHKGAVQVLQPDGTSLTIQLNGDEYYSFVTTSDGYTVLLTTQGTYEYARRVGQRLVTTGVIAHDPQYRSASEKAMLQGMTKRMTDYEAVGRSKMARAQRDAQPSHVQRYDYTKFKGLIILVNFSDVQFTMSNPKDFYDHMINDENFTGYVDDNGNQVQCTGSVRDYFDDQSVGLFKPHFDVYGPVNLTTSSTYGGKYKSSVFPNVLAAINSQVNFADYDTNNDGVVDMVFFLFAELSSSFSGNNPNLLWPHRAVLSGYTRYDGKYVRDYACSNELYGMSDYPSTITVEGIGTFCHEFSHVLGLPDFYDADYEQSGGESHHPGEWDLMAGGGAFNYARTPCGYTIFERYSLGWANPQVITEPGNFDLGPINLTNQGYIIKSPLSTEYFILDNRQKQDWDQYVPGHGMIIARVDSSNVNIWNSNQVNNFPEHNYFELLRAGNTTSGDLPSDPFPGTTNNQFVFSRTQQNLNTWSGEHGDLYLHKITETSDGVIHFSVAKESEMVAIVEDFETTPLNSNIKSTDQPGRFTLWNFTNANVMAPADSLCNGERAVGVFSPCAITMGTDISYKTYLVTVDLRNPTTIDATYKLYYSTNQGASWSECDNSLRTAPAKSNTTMTWALEVNQPVRLRINMTSGPKTKTNKCYLDDIYIYHYGELSESLLGDVNGDGQVDISDVNAVINMMLGKAEMVDAADINGDGQIDISDVNAVINLMLGKA